MAINLFLRSAFLLLALFIFYGAAAPAAAHTIRPSVATVVVAADGGIDVRIRANVEAMLADIGPEYTDTNDSPNAAVYDELRSLGPDQITKEFALFLPRFLADSLLVSGSDKPVALEYAGIEVPETGDIELTRDSTIVLRGKIPADTQELFWSWPSRYGSSVVRFSGPGSASPQSEWLQTGIRSSSYAIDGTAEEFSTGRVIRDYLIIGFEHIVPLGVDHILFVVGIFLLSIKLKPLLLQVTAFTLAHTITLGLSIYGIISMPPSIVEPLIALSIAYVGIENCFSAKLQPWRLALVFGFGLLHGLGFAGVLTDIGLPRSEFLTALISFNVGVEFGQLSVICGCLILFGWCRKRDWYRSVVVIPLSALIAVIALYWTWERVFG